MKYLSNRTEYLTAKYKVINENVAGAGPFANDIAWGDSLLGRMLHSFARKARIGVNLVRMDSVIKRLQTQFDYLLDVSKVDGADIDEVTKHEIDMLRISILLGTLIKAIKDPESEGKDHLDEIIKTTKEIIREITRVELQTNKSEVDREEVLVKLKDFLTELESIGTGNEINKEVKSETKESNKVPYNLYMANIKSISDLLNSYKNIKSKGAENVKSKEELQREIDLSYKKKIEEWKSSQKAMRTNNTGSNINPGEGTRNRIRREVEAELAQESFIFENTNTNGILNATKSLYSYMMSSPENLTELVGFVSSYENKNKVSSGNFASIKRLYDYIRKTSISENLDSLLSNSDKLGNKIKELYNVSKSGDFTSIQDEGLKNSLTSFNQTLSAILTHKSEVKEVQNNNESRLLKYKSFRKVFESEEEITQDTNTKEEDEYRYDLSIPWNKYFSEKYLRKWAVTEELQKKVNQKLEKIEREGNRYVIKGIDPILEIVKIFNRSYKLHTSQTIPGSRKAGKVSNRKMGEYEYIGKGSGPNANDEGSGFKAGMGPYRNIKIFTKWEDAVLDILKDSKYQVLFNEDTIIEVGDADSRMNVDYSTNRNKNSIEKGVDNDGDITKTLVNKKEKRGRIEGGGKVLLKFINDMLDGDTLYRGESGGGAQKKFINTYFKVDVKTEELGFTEDELDINAKSANDTKDETIVEFKGVKEVINKDGCIFNINDSYHMIITGSDNDFVYVKYSKTFGNIKKYIRGEKVRGMKGDLSTLDDNKTTIYYARINKDHFREIGDKKVLKLGDDLKLKSIDLSSYNEDSIRSKSEEVEIGNIDSLYVLREKSGKQYFLPTSASQDSGSGDKPRKSYGALKDKLK